MNDTNPTLENAESIINVKEEYDPILQEFANDNDVVLLTFLSSYVPRRYGPDQFAGSEMSIRDELVWSRC